MEFTAKQLAHLAGGETEGNPDVVIDNFAKIEEARPGCVTFLANPKYTHYIYTTQASAVIVRKDFMPEQKVTATLIKVDDPYSTLAELMGKLCVTPIPEGIEQPCFIAENAHTENARYIGAFAYIGKGVKLGKNVAIYPQAYIGDNVTIDDDSIIYAGARIYHDCHIGKRCIVHSGAVIGADGFGFAPTSNGYEKIPQIGIVTLEDDTEVGANTTIDRATMGSTLIGRGTKLDNLIQIGHNVVIGRNNVFAAQGGVAGSTHIGDNNMIGGQVGFAGHITVGDNNEFGAQSGVPNSVGSHKRLLGSPAIDARTYARMQVYLKNIDKLFKK